MEPEPMEPETNECPICDLKYTKHHRVKIKCIKCNEISCKQCIQNNSRINKVTLRCLSCNEEFDKRTIRIHFSAAAVKNNDELIVLKFIEEEMSKMDETLPLAQEQQENKERTLKYAKHCVELQKQLEEAIANITLVFQEKKEKLDIEFAMKSKEPREKVHFIKNCPNKECRGKLSNKYKCGLCDVIVCSKCLQIKGDDHECKEDDLLSVKEIKKNTKDCPSCGTSIYKVSGCDQMWCTECHKAFSWKTGKLVKGIIHNPHYFQWKAATGNTLRNPGDVVCGGIPYFTPFHNSIQVYPNSIRSVFIGIYQGIAESQELLRDQRQLLQDEGNNVELRIDYLLKKITKEEFDNILSRKYRKIMRTQNTIQLYELYNTFGIEHLNFITSHRTNIEMLTGIIGEFHKMKEYINHELMIMNHGSSCIVKQIHDNFHVY